MYYFYPRSPCGERLFLLFRLVAGFLFLSTLSLRRATALSLPFGAVWIISIHALLAESDNKNLLLKRSRFIFLSTLSLRRATEHTNNGSNANLHFYPRSPCGERPVTLDFKSLCHYFYPRSPCGERLYRTRSDIVKAVISIHALLAESDHVSSQSPSTTATNFYPRSPCGERRHQQGYHQDCQQFLSTLSLRRATAAGRFLLS